MRKQNLFHTLKDFVKFAFLLVTVLICVLE